MTYLVADDLREMFVTKGAFYKRELDGEVNTCRGLAKIIRRGVETTVADALFVMVNPGSCQPADKGYQFPSYTTNLMQIPLVHAQSDPTQYQIMRLMERMSWNMIYIINLSDLRAGKIAEFKSYLSKFEAQNNDTHSIFSENRLSEIEMLLSKNTRIIAAWGTQPFMRSKMFHALTVLSNLVEIHGLPHVTKPYYYHPFPMVQHKCIKWLDDMCIALK